MPFMGILSQTAQDFWCTGNTIQSFVHRLIIWNKINVYWRSLLNSDRTKQRNLVLFLNHSGFSRCCLTSQQGFVVGGHSETFKNHLTTSDLKAIKEAIDKATNCDFEIVNLSFGSSLNMKNYTPDYLEKCKKFYLCAKKKGMEIGDYSLIWNWRIKQQVLVVMNGCSKIMRSKPKRNGYQTEFNALSSSSKILLIKSSAQLQLTAIIESIESNIAPLRCFKPLLLANTTDFIWFHKLSWNIDNFYFPDKSEPLDLDDKMKKKAHQKVGLIKE